MNAPVKLSLQHEAARAWAEAGFAVFPCSPSLKTPATANGLHDTTTDLDKIDAWWTACPSYNVGIVPGKSNCFVLDVDPPLGAESLASLCKDHGPLPDTLTIRTPRGGLHYWFTGKCPSTVGRLGPKLDTRGDDSGYVLVPPSSVNGNPYTYESEIETIAPGPEWIPASIENAQAHVAATADVELDLPGNVARAVTLLRDYVAQGKVAIEGAGGDNLTYAVAAEVLNLGLSPDKAFEILRDQWNPSCIPPWEADDLATKVGNAVEYSQNEAGAWATPPAKELFAEAAKLASADATDHPEPFGNLLTCPTTPVQEIIPGLIERGIPNFLCGPGGSGKSRLKNQFGLSVAAGKSVFGRLVQQVTFVDLNAEDTRDEIERRGQAIVQRLNLPTTLPAFYWDRVGKNSALALMYEGGTFELSPFYHTLCDFLRSIEGHKLVALDSCYDFVRFAGKAKIDEGSVNAFVKNVLQALCNETNSTLLVVWHPSQAGSERGAMDGWSVAWNNAPRNRLSIAPLKDTDDAFELAVAKRNHGRRGAPLTLYFSAGALLPKTEVAVEDQAARYLDACVAVAIMAAKAGTPIQQQRRLNTWMVDEIERGAGFRPSDRDAKDTLARAVSLGRLRYLKGTNRRVAGYYPPDELQADELAVAAKHHGTQGGDDV